MLRYVLMLHVLVLHVLALRRGRVLRHVAVLRVLVLRHVPVLRVLMLHHAAVLRVLMLHHAAVLRVLMLLHAAVLRVLVLLHAAVLRVLVPRHRGALGLSVVSPECPIRTFAKRMCHGGKRGTAMIYDREIRAVFRGDVLVPYLRRRRREVRAPLSGEFALRGPRAEAARPAVIAHPVPS